MEGLGAAKGVKAWRGFFCRSICGFISAIFNRAKPFQDREGIGGGAGAGSLARVTPSQCEQSTEKATPPMWPGSSADTTTHRGVKVYHVLANAFL